MTEDSVHRTNAPRAKDGVSEELRKPHEMIVMMPRSGRVTLTGRRLYNALLQASQTYMETCATMPPADFMFSSPLPVLLRATGSSGDDRTAAKKYLKEMRGLEVDWESTSAGDGVKWRGFSLLSEVAIEIKNGENWVFWSYPPTLMSALREPARWARLNLEVLGKLSTYTALALYEICARYRDNPSGLTCRNETKWWIDALSNAPVNSERREWRKFKSEKIKNAVDEINSATDIEVELIEHKNGRLIVEIQFSVRRKRQTTKANAYKAIDADIVRIASNLNIREIKIDALVHEYGEENVRNCLRHLNSRYANPHLKMIDNAYSYLRTLLKNGGVEKVNFNEVSNENKVDQSSINSKKVSEILMSSASSRTVAGIEKNEDIKRRSQISALKLEIQNLTPAERQFYVQQAISKLIEKGLFTPVIRRRAEQGDQLHGVLGSMVIQCYAEVVYGDKWAEVMGGN